MQTRQQYLHICISMLTYALLLASIVGIIPFTRDHPASAAPTKQILQMHRIQAPPALLPYHPTLMHNVKGASSAADPVRFACQSNDHPQPSLCYGPYQVRQAYDITDLLSEGFTGKGTSITIIDAYGSPYIRQDLETFDRVWGLPDPKLNIIAPYGNGAPDSAWISETSLDVEWAHVMAPEATINLVLAKDSNDYNIYRVLAYAIHHNLGDIISLSFGENENCVDQALRLAEHRVFKEAASKGVTLLAATGDFGENQPACDSGSLEKAVSFPADDPLVTGVGGTTLTADAETGAYSHEVAWNESRAFNKATGGGFSHIYRTPTFQQSLAHGGPGRGVPDISLNASVRGGVIVFERHHPNQQPVINIMGGTSAAAPEMAGLLADGVQMAHHRLGAINRALYQIGTGTQYHHLMHDITSGDNLLRSTKFRGYQAGPGWDPATGWGTPRDAKTFLSALIHNLTPARTPHLFPRPTASPTLRSITEPRPSPTHHPTSTPTASPTRKPDIDAPDNPSFPDRVAPTHRSR